MVVGLGRMMDNFLSMPGAESPPFYSMVIKLACVCLCGAVLKPFITPKHTKTSEQRP